MLDWLLVGGWGVRDCFKPLRLFRTACFSISPPSRLLSLSPAPLLSVFLCWVIRVFKQKAYGMGGQTLYFAMLRHSFINPKTFFFF